MKFVLDTNTLSFVMGGDALVSERLLAHDRTDLLVPQPAISEIEYGLARLPESKRKARLKRRFEVLLDELARASWTDGSSY